MADNEGERTSSHTSTHMTTRIEVVGRMSGRRRWTVEQKLGILPGTDFGHVDVEVADGVGAELPTFGFVASDFGQPGYVVALQAAVQR